MIFLFIHSPILLKKFICLHICLLMSSLLRFKYIVKKNSNTSTHSHETKNHLNELQIFEKL